MINPQKVRAMSRKTLFEQRDGKEVLEIKKYVEDLPVWKSITKGALTGVLLYALVMFVVLLVNPEMLNALSEQMGAVTVMILLAVTMALVAVAYSLFTDMVFRKRLKKRKSTMCRYRSDVRFLEKSDTDSESTKS